MERKIVLVQLVLQIPNHVREATGIQSQHRQKTNIRTLGVEMAVCRQDMLYKDYTSNPIPTSFLYLKSLCDLCYEITGKSNF